MIINPFLSWWRQILASREMTSDEAPRESEKETAPWSDPSSLAVRVGAWTGWGSMVDDKAAERDVKFAVSTGLRRLDVMVNDHSKARAPQRFDTYKQSRIIALCRRAVSEGLEVHLTSWIMPHESYLKAASIQLLEIHAAVGAASIMFDAEEPWTQAQGSFSYEASALLVSELFSNVRWGVTGIGYTPASKVGPLAKAGDYIVPQCYSTSSSGLDPATAAPKLSQRWKEHVADRELIVGLAAYRQSGIKGYSTEEAVRSAFNAARSSGAREVVYWSLRHIRGSTLITKTIRNMAAAQADGRNA